MLAFVAWTWWAESHPRDERRLRLVVSERLHEWFPEQMALDDDQLGIHPRTPPAATLSGPRILLIHGLDEPGTIWDDLLPALESAGEQVMEFIYPNDQGIEQSADALAEHWSALPAGPPVILIGHSMGGLVARDFVSRLRHPVGMPAHVSGPAVSGLILLGTPNQGSEWARLRVWLELRDQFTTLHKERFSLFAALRDGMGEAKIDLRPGSDFLETLNRRPWPSEVPIRTIAGRLLTPLDPSEDFAAIAAAAHSDLLAHRLADWWSSLGEDLGDGVVSLESVQVPGGPPPLLVEASHRGMLMRLLPDDPQPPAIAPILEILEQWRATAPSSSHP